MRRAVALVLSAFVAAACSIQVAEPEPPVLAPAAPATAPPVVAGAGGTTTALPAPPTRYGKLRAFVTSESTNQVWVLEGAPGGQFAVVTRISVGTLPHQIAISPDGRWVAVNDRLSDQTSIIDPFALKEVVRIKVGKQPHGVTFSPDGATLYIGHERDVYIQPIEVGTWKLLPPIVTGVPQHVLLMGTNRPTELYFSLTNTSEADVLRSYDTQTKQFTRVRVSDVHDIYYTPDQSEIWSSSSGFLDRPSDRMVIYDPVTKTVKQEIHFPGHYPFHTIKENQDGIYYLPDRSLMVLADHTLPGLLWIDWKARKIVDQTKFDGQQQPFHSTYDPEGERVLTVTNVPGAVNVIDLRTHKVVQQVPVTKGHGIVAVGIP